MKKLFNLKNIVIVTLLGVSISGVMNAYDYIATSNVSKMLLQSTEALALGDLGGGFYKNFKKETVWYNSEISGGATVSEKPGFWVSGTWKSMVCCVNGTDMDACNFNLEDSECASRVTRNARS